MSEDRWPSQEYLLGLSKALRLLATSLFYIRIWLLVLAVLLGLILWRVW